MMAILFPILVILILIALNGLFVAAEFSIVGAPRTRLAQLAEDGSATARRILRTIKNIDLQNRYIATAQVGITIASLGLGMYGEHIVSEWFLGPINRFGGLTEPAAHTLAVALAITLLTYLHVVFGEMVPKSVALHSAEETVLRLEGPMALMKAIFLPVVIILNATGNAILRLLRIPPAAAGSRLMTPDELEFVVEESYAGGLIEADEQLFIENIFDLSERSVGHAMTPRTRITGIPAGAAQQEVLQTVCEAHFTRLPVYEGNLDQIVGILHAKNLARQQVHQPEHFDLHALCRPAVYVPDSLSLEEMLVRFRREGIQMAVVMDEFGGTAGLVTLEDIVEEVVGEILDEFDQEIAPIQMIAAGRARVRGDLLLDEVNQHFDLALTRPDADTVGGLLMSLLGRVLQPGDSVEMDGVRFEVETVMGHSVETVIVELPPGEDSQPRNEEGGNR